MPRTPKRLAGPLSITGASATRYTTPASTKTILRHLHFSNPTGGALTITASIGADAAGLRLFDAYSLAAGTVLDHFCYYVLEAAEILAANASGAVVMTVDGDEYTLG